MTQQTGLHDRYWALREGIERAARMAGRDPASVQLVVASKTQPVEAIESLIQIGHRLFGENRVQEAVMKWLPLKQKYPDVKLHLIGPLQTNKTKDAVRLFDVIETLDRVRLVHTLAQEQIKQDKRLRYMIEVNIGSEPQKSGIAEAGVTQLLAECHASQLGVDGLMCVPPAGQDASPYFRRMSMLGQELCLSYLSMGMTADYPVAIASGATHVRVGTAIFGPR